MMDSLIQLFTDNPVYLAVAVVLALVILVGVIKKLMKLVLLVAAVLVLYLAYFIWTGQEVPKYLDSLQTKIEKTVKQGKKTLKKTGEELQEKSKQIAKDKIQETAKKALDQ